MQRSYVRDALYQAYTEAFNAYNAPYQVGADRYNAYFEWAHRTARTLQNVISPSDVSQLVLTPRYWALYSVAVASAAPVVEAINLELAARVDDLKLSYGQLDLLAQRWDLVDCSGVPAAFVIADTNVFLHHPDRLDVLDLAAELGLGTQPVHLVIPMTVLDELDNAKDKGQGEARSNARTTIKLLDGYLKDPGVIGQIRPASDPATEAPCGAFTVELLADPPGHVPLARADDEIIDRAVALQDLAGRPVTVVTGDIGMSTRARLAGLAAKRLVWPELLPRQLRGQRS